MKRTVNFPISLLGNSDSGIKLSADNLLFFFIALTFCLLPVRTALPLIALGLSTAVWLFSGKVLSCRILKKKWFFPALLFVALPWIGLLYSKDLDLGMDYALKTKYWIAAFLTAALVLNEKRVRIIQLMFWLSLSCGSVLAFFQYMELMPAPKSTFFGFGLVYTVLSMYLLIGILTASHRFRYSSSTKVKLGMIILIIVFLFHLSVLEGRNGYFVLLLISPFIVHNLVSKLPIIAKGVVLFILIGSLALSPVVQDRIKETLDHLKKKETILKGKDDRLFPRPFIFHQTFKLIKLEPIFGIGTGSQKFYTKETGHPIHHPHNNILYMTVSFGILGALSYLWLSGYMIIRAWKSRESQLGYFIFSTGVVIFLGGFFDTLIINSGTSLLLPLGYGLLKHLQKDESN